MIALQRIGNAPPGKEDAPQEGSAAALLLQHGEVDVQHQILPGIIAQQVCDMIQFLSVRDLEHHLALCPRFRLAVKVKIERPVEQLRKACGKVGILRDDTDLRGAERVAVEQDTVGLRPGAAQLQNRQAA